MKRIILLILFLCFSSVQAAQLGSYGFEDWDTDIHTTPGYPFGTNYEEFWCVVETCNPTKYATNPTYYDGYVTENHEATTEVVTSYVSNHGGTWTAHSGSYYLLINDTNDYAMSPAVTGIDAGNVLQNVYLGLDNPAYGGQDRLAWDFDNITSGIFFIRFWARVNKGFYSINNGGRCKWIVVGADSGTGVFAHLGTNDGQSPDLYFYNEDEGGWLGTTGNLTNAFDGAWHKFSLMINYNTGSIYFWYDVESETLANATKSWTAGDGQISTSTAPRHVHIQGNFSGQTPSESTYHALDDIEIWDELPAAASSGYSGFTGNGASGISASGSSAFSN